MSAKISALKNAIASIQEDNGASALKVAKDIESLLRQHPIKDRDMIRSGICREVFGLDQNKETFMGVESMTENFIFTMNKHFDGLETKKFFESSVTNNIHLRGKGPLVDYLVNEIKIDAKDILRTPTIFKGDLVRVKARWGYYRKIAKEDNPELLKAEIAFMPFGLNHRTDGFLGKKFVSKRALLLVTEAKYIGYLASLGLNSSIEGYRKFASDVAAAETAQKQSANQPY